MTLNDSYNETGEKVGKIIYARKWLLQERARQEEMKVRTNISRCDGKQQED